MRQLAFYFFLILGLLVSLAGCAPLDNRDATEKKIEETTISSESVVEYVEICSTITIGVALLDEENLFISQLKKAMSQTADDVGVVLIFKNGKNNPQKQVKHVEEFISQMVDIIILNAASYSDCAPAVDLAVQKGIPIVTVNTKVENQYKCESFIGSDAVQSGRLQLQSVANVFDGKCSFLYLKGPIGHEAELGRKIGMNEILSQFPDMHLIYEQSANWSMSEAYIITKNSLATYDKIDAVVAQNDEMALGALQAINDAGKSGQIKVFGIDAIPEALQAIKEGEMESTVLQNADIQGKEAILAAKSIALGKKVKKEIMISYKLIDKENINFYLSE